MNKLVLYLKGEKGIAYIKGILIILVLLPFFGAVIDRTAIYYIRSRAKDSLTYAVESAAKKTIVLENNTVVFDKPSAESKFYEILRKNFDLDGSLTPRTSTSYIKDTISVTLVLWDDETTMMPINHPLTSEILEYPTIYAIARVPIRLFFMEKLGQLPLLNGIEGMSANDLEVHVVVSSEDFL